MTDHLKALGITLLVGIFIGAGFVIYSQSCEIDTLTKEKMELSIKLDKTKDTVITRVIERRAPDGTSEVIKERETTKEKVIVEQKEKLESIKKKELSRYAISVSVDYERRVYADIAARLGNLPMWAVVGTNFAPDGKTLVHIGIRLDF